MPTLSTPTLTEDKPKTAAVQFPSKGPFRENGLTALLFALALTVLSIKTLVQFPESPMVTDENRPAAKFPPIGWDWNSIHSFPPLFENFFNDRFAYRHSLVHAKALICLKLTHLSVNRDVLQGKNGFFFYADEGNLPLILKSWPFTPDQMNAWKMLLEKRASWCREHGMDYYFVIAPTKPSIYPEFLPKEYCSSGRDSRADQLLAFLKQAKSPVNVIDLRSALLSHKSSMPLFLKTDTHWNDLGSYYGYRGLIERLQENHPAVGSPRNLSDFMLLAYSFNHGDLGRMQGLYGWLKEVSLRLFDKKPQRATLVHDPKWTENPLKMQATEPFGYRQNNSNLPRAIMFRDSFAIAWSTMFLPDHFSSITYFWQRPFSRNVVIREKPNIVLQEEIETCFYSSLPEDI